MLNCLDLGLRPNPLTAHQRVACPMHPRLAWSAASRAPERQCVNGDSTARLAEPLGIELNKKPAAATVDAQAFIPCRDFRQGRGTHGAARCAAKHPSMNSSSDWAQGRPG